MRIRLFAAVASAPLCLALGSGLARAQDTVTSGVSSPIATATAGANGTPADIDITTGSVSISTSAAAVTLNSSNSVVNAGTISVNNANSSEGVLANTSSGTLTASSGTAISNAGSITNGDGFSAATNSDGSTEAPFATPTSFARYGIRLVGPNALVGDITNVGTISVSGANNNNTGVGSAGVSIEAPLTGNLNNEGTITFVGDGGAAIQSLRGAGVNGSIAGNVFLDAAVSAQGQSRAVDLEGDVGGRLSIYSDVTSTGYALSTRPTTSSLLNSIQSNADQVEQSLGGVTVNGSVGAGVLIAAPPIETTSTSTGDLDGDGIVDSAEGTGAVVNYGSGAALAIGANSANGGTTIGAVDSASGLADASANAQSVIKALAKANTATPGLYAGLGAAPATLTNLNAFGVIVRGSIDGQGVYDGVSATGLQIGSLATSSAGVPYGVTVDGGVRVVGSVSAEAYGDNATAIHILSGATVPTLQNEDFVASTVFAPSGTGTLATTLTPTTTAASSAILIEKGARVTAINNFGTLQANANGDRFSAAAVRDLSGTVSGVLNEGLISATSTPTTSGASAASGSEAALDLSANTTGVTLVQTVNPNPLSVEVSTTTTSTGQVSTTAALTSTVLTDTNTSGVATSTSTLAPTTTTVTTTTSGVTTTTVTTTPTTPEIVGDVLLGNGPNTVQILAGSVTGALSLGDGTGGSLTVGGSTTSATINGPVTFGGSGLALSVVNGSLVNTSATTLRLSSLNVGASGVLFAAIDPQSTTQTSTLYSVAGPATLAAGAELGIVLKSPLLGEGTFTVVQATPGQLADGTNGAALQQSAVPYLITGTESSNAATGAITLDLRPKTTAELGLNPAEAAALPAVLGALTQDAGVGAAVLGQYAKGSFLGVYDQLLPDYSGGLFELTLAASDAVTRATSRINDIDNPSGTRGAWAQEVAFGVNHDADQTAGYQGGGFGLVGGLETGGLGLGAFGLTGAFLTGDVKDPHAPGDNLQSFSEGEFGGYWQGQLGGFRADARAAGGYILYADRRELQVKDASNDITLDRQSKASSSGYTATGHFQLGYQTPDLGLFYFRPQVRGDYFYLDQGSYVEHGGGVPVASGSTAAGDGFDLAVSQRNGNEASGTASLVTGLSFGQGFRWRPELELGYRDVFSGTAGATTARFAGVANGAPFTLQPDDIKGGGPVARLDVKADTDFYELNFEAGAEQRTNFVEGDLRLSVRVLF